MKRFAVPFPKLVVLAAATVLLVIPGIANAVPSYSLDIVPGDAQNNFNVPKFILSNDSTAGERIDAFSFSIGDEAHFFDFVLDAGSSPAGLPANLASEGTTGATLTMGDRDNDRTGVTILEWVFSHFQAGEQLVFEVDVDPLTAQSGGSQKDDASQVFFDNGLAANSQLGIVFSDGSTVDLTLPDPTGGPFHFDAGVVMTEASIPEPSVAVLMGMGLLGLAFAGRARD